mmetsp:Transcript_4168/g.13122  ORF Transcript_4168/g.13122 Transcript_4168/m.13122 type:complete len:207 (+) Transcript_4168:526-1146(+)
MGFLRLKEESTRRSPRQRTSSSSQFGNSRPIHAQSGYRVSSHLEPVRQLEAENAGSNVPLHVRRRAESDHQLGLGEGPPQPRAAVGEAQELDAERGAKVGEEAPLALKLKDARMDHITESELEVEVDVQRDNLIRHVVQRERHHRAHLGGLRLVIVVPPVYHVRALDVDLEGPDQVLPERLLALRRVCADAERVRVIEDPNLQARF